LGRNWNVTLVLLERSWWAGFNGIYLVRFGFRILILKWFLPLKIQINSKKTRFWKEKSVDNVVTLGPPAEGTNVDGWCTDGILFSIHVSSSQVYFFSLPFLSPDLSFLFWNFIFSWPPTQFLFSFCFWNLVDNNGERIKWRYCMKLGLVHSNK